jgi:TRAP-type C4-dicarboxylate transport system permease small subunit
MESRYSLVLEGQRHLKWRALDIVEQILMILCGVALGGFTTTVFCDVVTRTLGHPWLWLQEVTTTFFVYGVFIGTAAATRRNDHLYLSALTEAMSGRTRLFFEVFNRLVILGAALAMVVFGYINFLQGFGNFPHAVAHSPRFALCRDPALGRPLRPLRAGTAAQWVAERLRRRRTGSLARSL